MLIESFDGLVGGSISIALTLIMIIGIERLQRMKSAHQIRNRDHALNQMEFMSDKNFGKMFRMSKRSFKVLLQKLDDLNTKEDNYVDRKSYACMKTKLAITLRWLAGGSYIDICFAFGIGTGSFFHDDGVLWGTMRLIDIAFQIGFPFNSEGDLRKWHRSLSVLFDLHHARSGTQRGPHSGHTTPDT